MRTDGAASHWFTSDQHVLIRHELSELIQLSYISQPGSVRAPELHFASDDGLK